jgi:hypothetical protein
LLRRVPAKSVQKEKRKEMKLYKLTCPAPAYFTHNCTSWGEGVTHCGTGEGALCGPGWIHAYTDPLLAVLLNPIHGNFAAPLTLWEADGDVCLTDYGLKVGCRKLTTVRIIESPEVSIVQRVAFGILCALEMRPLSHSFDAWAQGWLSGADRSLSAAHAAGDAAHAAWDAAWDAARVAARAAAHAAAHAAWDAAEAAAHAAGDAAHAAGDAAHAAWDAAHAAWDAARVAARVAARIDLIALAQKAMEVK